MSLIDLQLFLSPEIITDSLHARRTASSTPIATERMLVQTKRPVPDASLAKVALRHRNLPSDQSRPLDAYKRVERRDSTGWHQAGAQAGHQAGHRNRLDKGRAQAVVVLAIWRVLTASTTLVFP